MKWSIKMKAGAVLLALALLSSIGVGCRQVLTLDSYMAVVPKVLQSGGTESVSLALFSGDLFRKLKKASTRCRSREKVLTTGQP